MSAMCAMALLLRFERVGVERAVILAVCVIAYSMNEFSLVGRQLPWLRNREKKLNSAKR